MNLYWLQLCVKTFCLLWVTSCHCSIKIQLIIQIRAIKNVMWFDEFRFTLFQHYVYIRIRSDAPVKPRVWCKSCYNLGCFSWSGLGLAMFCAQKIRSAKYLIILNDHQWFFFSLMCGYVLGIQSQDSSGFNYEKVGETIIYLHGFASTKTRPQPH